MLDARKITSDDFSLDLRSVYGAEGKLSESLDGFVERPQQLEMAQGVIESLTDGKNLLVEAGTGTGKSLAYLVPCAQFSLDSESPVVISTHTINLQEQLETSDIPLTRDILDDDLTPALVKGRENYVCPRRLNKAWQERHLRLADDRKERQLEKLMEWMQETEDGSRSDINFKVDGDVWSLVCSKRGVCKCLNQGDEDCFYARSWKKIQDADVLLVNHYLFMQDLALRMDSGFGLLPHYGVVVFDEAQHLEQVARQCLGLELSYLQFKYLRRDLFHPEKETGLLTVLGAEDLSEKVDRLDNTTEAFFNEIRAFHEEKSETKNSTLRVYESGIVHNSLDPVLSDLLRGLRNYHDQADLSKDDEDELKSMVNRITDLKQGLEIYLRQEQEDDVYWIERSSYRDNVTLRSSPVDVSDLLKDELFDPIYASISTSATLTTPSQTPFTYIKDRIGLDDARTTNLGHPFDYNDQVTLRIISDMTSPSENTREFTHQVSQWLNKLFAQNAGRSFVLFTSYKMLNKVAQKVRSTLENKGVKLLVQGGDLPRRKMLETFRNDQPAVIFGADAFWEGVDIPGENLSHVIITKLPFPNPADPLVEATSERLEKEGKNSFKDYYIPEAVLSLKQGFGRLIRSRDDTGEITILDSRIVKKSYGHNFLDALPDCNTVYETLDQDTTSNI